MKIWKYPVDLTSIDRFELSIPSGASICHVEAQGCGVCLWAMVNPESDVETRTFSVYGTGYDIRPDLHQNYIGTFMINNQTETFVGHVFEVTGMGA